MNWHFPLTAFCAAVGRDHGSGKERVGTAHLAVDVRAQAVRLAVNRRIGVGVVGGGLVRFRARPCVLRGEQTGRAGGRARGARSIVEEEVVAVVEETREVH